MAQYIKVDTKKINAYDAEERLRSSGIVILRQWQEDNIRVFLVPDPPTGYVYNVENLSIAPVSAPPQGLSPEERQQLAEQYPQGMSTREGYVTPVPQPQPKPIIEAFQQKTGLEALQQQVQSPFNKTNPILQTALGQPQPPESTAANIKAPMPEVSALRALPEYTPEEQYRMQVAATPQAKIVHTLTEGQLGFGTLYSLATSTLSGVSYQDWLSVQQAGREQWLEESEKAFSKGAFSQEALTYSLTLGTQGGVAAGLSMGGAGLFGTVGRYATDAVMYSISVFQAGETIVNPSRENIIGTGILAGLATVPSAVSKGFKLIKSKVKPSIEDVTGLPKPTKVEVKLIKQDKQILKPSLSEQEKAELSYKRLQRKKGLNAERELTEKLIQESESYQRWETAREISEAQKRLRISRGENYTSKEREQFLKLQRKKGDIVLGEKSQSKKLVKESESYQRWETAREISEAQEKLSIFKERELRAKELGLVKKKAGEGYRKPTSDEKLTKKLIEESIGFEKQRNIEWSKWEKSKEAKKAKKEAQKTIKENQRLQRRLEAKHEETILFPQAKMYERLMRKKALKAEKEAKFLMKQKAFDEKLLRESKDFEEKYPELKIEIKPITKERVMPKGKPIETKAGQQLLLKQEAKQKPIVKVKKKRQLQGESAYSSYGTKQIVLVEEVQTPTPPKEGFRIPILKESQYTTKELSYLGIEPMFQGNMSRQSYVTIERTETKRESRYDFLQSKKEQQSVILPKFKPTSREDILNALKYDSKQGRKEIQKIKPRQIQQPSPIFKLKFRPRPEIPRQPDFLPPPPREKPPKTPIVFPIVPEGQEKPDFWGNKEESKRILQYYPSLGGIVSGITISKPPKGQLTGLEIRYPIKKMRF